MHLAEPAPSNPMDIYSKLRPDLETERCECAEIAEVILVHILTRNPIHCSQCRKEIEPERLELSVQEANDIACCFRTYGALYSLWLDSGEYEGWAKERLLDPRGQVNLQGKTIAAALTKRWPTFYWWFWDTDDGIPESCPSCAEDLTTSPGWGVRRCHRCRVIM